MRFLIVSVFFILLVARGLIEEVQLGSHLRHDTGELLSLSQMEPSLLLEQEVVLGADDSLLFVDPLFHKLKLGLSRFVHLQNLVSQVFFILHKHV